MEQKDDNIFTVETVLGELEIRLPDAEPLDERDSLEVDTVTEEETDKVEIVMLHFKRYERT